MLCFILQTPSLEEIKTLFEVIASFLAILLILAGLFVFISWIRIARKNLFKLWEFIFWPPDATRGSLLLKCRKEPSGSCTKQILSFFSTYSTKYVNFAVKVPAVTLRGQIINPYPWPLVINDVKFSWSVLQTKIKRISHLKSGMGDGTRSNGLDFNLLRNLKLCGWESERFKSVFLLKKTWHVFYLKQGKRLSHFSLHRFTNK